MVAKRCTRRGSHLEPLGGAGEGGVEVGVGAGVELVEAALEGLHLRGGGASEVPDAGDRRGCRGRGGAPRRHGGGEGGGAGARAGERRAPRRPGPGRGLRGGGGSRGGEEAEARRRGVDGDDDDGEEGPARARHGRMAAAARRGRKECALGLVLARLGLEAAAVVALGLAMDGGLGFFSASLLASRYGSGDLKLEFGNAAVWASRRARTRYQ